jgi:hypothetical protein
MHFAKLSAVLIGLAAFVSALPNPHERRMFWNPRSLERKDDGSKNKNKDTTIIDTTVVKLTEQSRNSEIELTVKVEEKIQIEEQKKKAKDNVRKNHFRNKNKDVVRKNLPKMVYAALANTHQNTIIIVITEILDVRDSNNHNIRYMKHQLRADNKAQSDITIQVTEVEIITIDNSDSKHKDTKTKGGHNLAASGASGAVAAAMQTVDPNAPFAAKWGSGAAGAECGFRSGGYCGGRGC